MRDGSASTRWQPDRGRRRTTVLLAAAVVSLGLVAGLAYVDADRESRAALDDLAGEQVTLARGVAAAFATAADANAGARARLPRGLAAVEAPGTFELMLLPPGASALQASDGRQVASPRVVAAARDGSRVARLSRAEAAEVGLPARTALVGLARIDDGPLAGWTVAAIATARRERDRALGAQRRLILSVLTAGGLVLAFGGAALRNQRRELELARELALAAVRSDQSDRLARANRAAALGTLALGIAHEVSTPLGVISGRAEQLLPKLEHDERGAAAVSVILDQTSRIKQVIRGLLGLARGDQVVTDRVAPASVAAGALALVEHRFGQAGVKLTNAIADGLPAVVGDARLLENALVNLLLNACDACARGGHVELAVEPRGDRVGFVVSDDGVGISAHDAQKLVEPFFTTKPSGAGTGLGLAIANEIVACHRGALTLAPQTPRGTRAVIEIPVAARETRA